MSLTYPHNGSRPHDQAFEAAPEQPFVPVYARQGRTARGRKRGVRTWMILAPVGVLVLGAAAAAMMLGGRDEVAPAPLVEPAATAPVLPSQPSLVQAPPVEATPVAPVVEASPAPTPVARRAAPAARRPAAPAPAPAAAPRVVAPAEPAEPQPYTAQLNAAPAQPPVIVIQPAN